MGAALQAIVNAFAIVGGLGAAGVWASKHTKRWVADIVNTAVGRLSTQINQRFDTVEKRIQRLESEN